jgi:uncharacterized protein
MARMERGPDGWALHGTEVLISPTATLSCSFRVLVDPEWLTREVDAVSVSATGEQRLTLRVDEDRRWWRGDRRAPELDGCIDVDIAATPLTNTFPIRRFAALTVGDSATTPIAWVDVPSLEVTRVDQTYRRLGEKAWEYSDEQHGAFTLIVDDDGLVIDYQGFATRVTPGGESDPGEDDRGGGHGEHDGDDHRGGLPVDEATVQRSHRNGVGGQHRDREHTELPGQRGSEEEPGAE